ncbi:MAG: class I SAM-dependent methyltransferase, partial [Ginsengibacter sp.]
IEAKCLFCGAAESKESFYAPILFNNKQFVYRECLNCKLNYNYPFLTPDDYEKLYSISYHDEFYFKEQKDFSKQIRILQQQKDIISVIDFGCGDATFLNCLQKKGFKCTGVEFNPELVIKLSNEYPDITFHTVEDFFEQNDQYDCAHLGDVLEHMIQPAETVKMLSKKLRNGGYLFVEGPIEHNASVGYFFRKSYFSLVKKIKPNRIVDGAPYHTLLANKKNQLNFFKLMGYSTSFMEIDEAAWPFPDKFAEAKSMKEKIEFLVAKISLATAKIFSHFGNRFYYLGRKGV